MAKIDFTDLREEVIEHWEDTGADCFITENNGFNAPDPTKVERRLKPECEDALDDPLACINELGFDSISSYIAEKRKSDLLQRMVFGGGG